MSPGAVFSFSQGPGANTFKCVQLKIILFYVYFKLPIFNLVWWYFCIFFCSRKDLFQVFVQFPHHPIVDESFCIKVLDLLNNSVRCHIFSTVAPNLRLGCQVSKWKLFEIFSITILFRQHVSTENIPCFLPGGKHVYRNWAGHANKTVVFFLPLPTLLSFMDGHRTVFSKWRGGWNS